MTFYYVSFSPCSSHSHFIHFCGFFGQENLVDKKSGIVSVMVPLFNHYYKLQRGVFSVCHHRRGSSSCKSSQETFWAGFFPHLTCVWECFVPCCSDWSREGFSQHLQVQTCQREKKKKEQEKTLSSSDLNFDAAQGMQKVLIFIFTLCLKENACVGVKTLQTCRDWLCIIGPKYWTVY